MSLTLSYGPDTILNYRRLPYKPWYALAEFVDNSTQSYFNHEEELRAAYEREGGGLEVRVVYERDARILRISDNAMGMSRGELADALVVGKVPANDRQRSQFGMGLKTASTWFGNTWVIRTKKLGDEFEFETTVDVEKVARGEMDLPEIERKKPAEQHYTVIEIRDLNARLSNPVIGRIKNYLRSMYRVDLREGVLNLYWDETPLVWDEKLEFLKSHDGEEYKRDFKFAVGDGTATGWIGILGPGSSGRLNAGFTLLRSGRMIVGFPDAWRPQEIFGDQSGGRNDLINQRIVGEINLDDSTVSHTKDEVLWRDNDEEVVGKELEEIGKDYIAIARKPRKGDEDNRGPSDAEVQAALGELRSEMESPEFVDLISIEPVPDPVVVHESSQPMLEAAEGGQPNFVISIGDEFSCRTYLATDLSPQDLYYNSDAVDGADSLSVVINTSHPQWTQLGGAESVLAYLRHCVYDAIAEWQCRRKTGILQPDTIKGLKDSLLRLPHRIEDAGAGPADADPEVAVSQD